MPVNTPKVLNLVLDQRFQQSPDGQVWSHTPPAYPFFEQALQIFDRVRVIARTALVAEPPAKTRRVDGPGVELQAVPSYTGPFQYLRQRTAIESAANRIAGFDGAFLLRIPSQTAFVLASKLEQLGRPYAVELLTDPHDFFALGVSSHGLAYMFRPYFCRRSRDLCRRALAANFVTGQKTRAAHPTPSAGWNSGVSDVDLPAEAFLPLRPPRSGPIEIISVGFLDLLYKGQDVLIRALGQCRENGLDFRLTFAGDGENRNRLVALASSLGIGDRVRITGPLAGPDEVRSWLARSDLFVLPSRAEGIPRALLEAMAAGLPAICSDVGAMPDLLSSRWIVRSGAELQLASRILEFSRLLNLWCEIGAANQKTARNFERAILQPQRKSFYEAVLKSCSGQSSQREISNAA